MKGAKGSVSRSPALAFLVGALTAAPAWSATSRPLLATEAQLAAEAQLLRILARAPMRTQITELEALSCADPQGSTPAGKTTIRRAVDSIALAAVYCTLIDDADRNADGDEYRAGRVGPGAERG